ncbi:response regulator transcription factor [Anaerosporobacter sp.]|uniref:response regulator transcription factor n=1 Tax=Anaerosporobacter sp. TaxID=1872529 RepID=UPI00286EFDD5|nr:response regulator [Anaerosporobacter sp.]
MYRLLIVDDEEIEREGMANFIPWSNYGIELVGTAWNGVEGLEQIQVKRPDIVITDIKMPVMSGIQLIQEAKKKYTDIEFIVLSGYGEYEYTSQAMEEGIRHYILKPCDEEKVVNVLGQVIAEIESKQEKRRKEIEYQHKVSKLLPQAKEQLIRNILLDCERVNNVSDMYLKEEGILESDGLVLAIRGKKGFDYLEQFVIGNVLHEMLEDGSVLFHTTIKHDVVFILNCNCIEAIEEAYIRVKQEFVKISSMCLQAAISKYGKLKDMSELYIQVQDLFQMNEIEHLEVLLSYKKFSEKDCNDIMVFDYGQLEDAENYDQIIFEVYLAFLKMNVNNFKKKQKEELCELAIKLTCGNEYISRWKKEINNITSVEELFELVVDILGEKKGLYLNDKVQKRIHDILFAIYNHISRPEMSMQFLAKEVLFMNEDYFGRLFLNYWKEKFSTYILVRRITLAQRLLQYNPDIKISFLAESVGYSPDGQYFSKAFRKIAQMTPTEYRDLLKNEVNKN